MAASLTRVNKTLIFANIAVFAVQMLLGDVVINTFALWPPDAASLGGQRFHVWQLLTYGFLHGGLVHLLFNMLALYMFGTDIEQLFGPRRYLAYYLLCMSGAALTHLAAVNVTDLPPVPTVGASGGVFGLLLAFGLAYPRRTIMPLFPPIPMPAWLFVTLYGALELYLGVTQSLSSVAHFAHLGGMAMGFLLIASWYGGDGGGNHHRAVPRNSMTR